MCTSVNAQDNYSQNKSITALLKKKRDYNKRYGTGYRIQLYNGTEKRARTILRNFRSEFTWVSSKLSYEEPDWKVKVGNYKTKLEAFRALNKINEKFSGAIIIPF